MLISSWWGRKGAHGGQAIVGNVESGGGAPKSKDQAHAVIWNTVTDGNFIVAETATANIREFGTPEGSFEITDTVSASYDLVDIDETIFPAALSAGVWWSPLVFHMSFQQSPLHSPVLAS